MFEHASLQLLLQQIRDRLCGGNAAELARRIKKDPTYVNRLFYPPGKAGAKRIGLEIMAACNDAFGLPRGFWEGAKPDWHLPGPSSEDVLIPQFDVSKTSHTRKLLVHERQPGIIKSWQVSAEWLASNARHHTGAANLCILTAFGQSMQPAYNPGDPLLVDLGVRTVEADGIYFFRVAEHAFVKQLQRLPVEGGVMLRAKSFNPTFDSFDITPKMDLEVLGRVLTLWKSEHT